MKTAPKEFCFDVKMFACIRVQAKTLKQAQAMVREHLDAAACNAGAWPNGDPILFEASVDGELELAEINGECV